MNDKSPLSRRKFLENTSAALVALGEYAAPKRTDIAHREDGRGGATGICGVLSNAMMLAKVGSIKRIPKEGLLINRAVLC